MVETTALLKPAAFGEIFGVTERTVQHWIARGRVRVVLSPSGRKLIPRAEVERLLAPRLLGPAMAAS